MGSNIRKAPAVCPAPCECCVCVVFLNLSHSPGELMKPMCLACQTWVSVTASHSNYVPETYKLLSAILSTLKSREIAPISWRSSELERLSRAQSPPGSGWVAQAWLVPGVEESDRLSAEVHFTFVLLI